LLTVALLAATSATAQTTWCVDDDAPNDPGPGDPAISDPLEDGSPEHPFDAIQEGINAAVNGDAVLVLDGTYTGDANRNLDFGGKAIAVRSDRGPADAVVDCEWLGRGFHFHRGEGAASVADGFTIVNGCPGGYNDGGGIYCAGSSPVIVNCVITNCSADDGGGIYCTDGSSPTIMNSVISGNAATGAYGAGGGIYCSQGPAAIVNCIICGNAAGRLGGGGLHIRECAATVMNCVIAQNTTTGELASGGGIYAEVTDVTIANCTIVGNSADVCGGGIICKRSGNPAIANCTITGNIATRGGGVSIQSGADSVAVNCLLWGNVAELGPEIELSYGSWHRPYLTISYSNVEGGEAAVYVLEGAALIWGVGNIDADPLFADPDGPDDDPDTWQDNDYHLTTDSPCVDAGDPDFLPQPAERDIDGQLRVWDGDGDGVARIDMGSDEFGSPCLGDLDGDGDVDLSDLAQVLAHYGMTEGATYADGDLDRDQDVDLSDLGALLAVYGTSCG